MKKTARICILLCMMIIGVMSVANASVSVNADNKYFDFMSGSYVLEGNVLVQTDTRTIGADKATVKLTTKEVWADGNIFLEEPEEGIYFSGGNLYASDESKTATIKGNVVFKREGLTIKATRCDFNWKSKIAEFSGLVEVDKDNEVKTYDVLHYNVIENKILE